MTDLSYETKLSQSLVALFIYYLDRLYKESITDVFCSRLALFLQSNPFLF